MHMNEDTVWVKAELVHETPKAFQVLIKDTELWVPKKVVVDVSWVQGVIGIAAWWAKERKLRSEW